jgi:hypothetical protein
VGDNVEGFAAGDRVAHAAAGGAGRLVVQMAKMQARA